MLPGLPSMDSALKLQLNAHSKRSSGMPLKGLQRAQEKKITKLNLFLERFKACIIQSYQQMVLKKVRISLTLLKSVILGTQDARYSLKALIEYHNENEKVLLEWGTMKNYLTTHKYVLAFVQKHYRQNNLPLTELTISSSLPYSFTCRSKKWSG